jgi:pilus assembly protein Flp/PilA
MGLSLSRPVVVAGAPLHSACPASNGARRGGDRAFEGFRRGVGVMNALKNFLADEAGGEVLEYALIAGLIIVGAIVAITSVGNKVLAKWQSVDDGMGS